MNVKVIAMSSRDSRLECSLVLLVGNIILSVYLWTMATGAEAAPPIYFFLAVLLFLGSLVIISQDVSKNEE
jgi:hypothetical protein